MRNMRSSVRAIAILAAAGAAAFAVSTAAVSSATTQLNPLTVAVKYPFAAFGFTGGVSTSIPSKPRTFTLSFAVSFTLARNSPGIVNKATGTLDKVTTEERVSYPVPAAKAAAQLVGPALLPFSSEKLALTISINGGCFVHPVGALGFVFRGSLKCATSTLTLGSKSYKASSLLRSLTGSFTQSPTGAPKWTGSLRATFANPGYTFPVATLGSGGGTSLTIGPNGASVATRSIVFSG